MRSYPRVGGRRQPGPHFLEAVLLAAAAAAAKVALPPTTVRTTISTFHYQNRVSRGVPARKSISRRCRCVKKYHEKLGIDVDFARRVTLTRLIKPA